MCWLVCVCCVNKDVDVLVGFVLQLFEGAVNVIKEDGFVVLEV